MTDYTIKDAMNYYEEHANEEYLHRSEETVTPWFDEDHDYEGQLDVDLECMGVPSNISNEILKRMTPQQIADIYEKDDYSILGKLLEEFAGM